MSKSALNYLKRLQGKQSTSTSLTILLAQHYIDDLWWYPICFWSAECSRARYLFGLLTFSLWSKCIQFAYLRDRVFKRTNSWASKMFSVRGKEILIKSVLQVIPSCAMSCFKFHHFFNEFEQLWATFWWKSSRDNVYRGMHWVSWNKLCKPKQLGGIDFSKHTGI